VYKIKQLGYIILKMKVKKFDKSHCSGLVVVGSLRGQLTPSMLTIAHISYLQLPAQNTDFYQTLLTSIFKIM